jgi:hypothetical protein
LEPFERERERERCLKTNVWDAQKTVQMIIHE